MFVTRRMELQYERHHYCEWRITLYDVFVVLHLPNYLTHQLWNTYM